jgi:hypothetical protein
MAIDQTRNAAEELAERHLAARLGQEIAASQELKWVRDMLADVAEIILRDQIELRRQALAELEDRLPDWVFRPASIGRARRCRWDLTHFPSVPSVGNPTR